MGKTVENLKILPLHHLHENAKAKFGGFAGWNMPLTYPLGVMQEHLHCRTMAGLFDISHMKLIEIIGKDAGNFLAKALPLDANGLKIGQSRYNYLLNSQAGILDDLIVTRLGDHRFMVVANAGNADMDILHFQERLKDFVNAQKSAFGQDVDCQITPLERVFIALQGPKAAKVLADLNIFDGELTFMHGFEPKKDWFMTRSGYTGEDGFEIALPIEQGIELAETLLKDQRVAWIGLAARDSLRLEAGLCLHGNDITVDNNPVEAGILWAVPKYVRENGQFVGAQALRTHIACGAQRLRVGLKPETRQPVRGGADIFDTQGNLIGKVTSGGFGPSFDGPVAMGYVEKDFAAIGTKIHTNVRGKDIILKVHALPFIKQRYFKG